MRAWVRGLVFDHLSWQLRVVTGLLHGAFALWCLAHFFDVSPIYRVAVFSVTVAAAFPIMAFAAPIETRGHTFLAQRQAILEVAFSAAALGGAVLTGALVESLAAGVLGLAWAGTAEAMSATVRICDAFVGVSAASLAWGFTGGRLQFEYRQVTLPALETGCASRELRIVHLSDLHLGNGRSARDVDALVPRIARLEPDLIVITGDFFDQRRDVVDECARALAALQAPLGVFAIFGNHDVYTGKAFVAEALAARAPNITLLRDDFVYLDEVDLWIAGVEDPGDAWCGAESDRAAIEGLAVRIDFPERAILLIHRPEAFDLAVACGFRVVLAGHYHGGQIALPGSAGAVNAATALVPYDRDLHRLGEAALYVSRGLGTAGPRLRVACPGEITTHCLAVGRQPDAG